MEENKIDPASLQKSLEGIDYPATKDQLVEQADRNGAEPKVVQFLERIPEQDYASPTEVSEQLGELSETESADEM